ncbi:MAG: amidohydrolase family protein [Promethearchaeota archaeon]
MILYQDEEYVLFDAHSHFSNLVARPLKFLFKSMAIYEIIDLIFTNWHRFKRISKDRTEKNVYLYKLIMDNYHIDKAIHLPVFKMDRKLSYRMNEMFPERMVGFGYINPNSKHLGKDLEELVAKNVCGIKIHPDIMEFRFKTHVEELIKIFEFCGQNKIIILSHTGSHSDIVNIIPILKKCEESLFIIGHSGLCPQIDHALTVARECPNSYLEMCGNPYTYKFLEAIKDPKIGIERILFGTDIPSLHPRVEIEKVLGMPISVEEKRMIFAKNLENLLKNYASNKYKYNLF